MDKNAILAYTALTPENLNPAVLSIMLDNLIADSSASGDSSQSDQTSVSPTLYWYPETEMDDILDLPENPIPGSLLVTQEEKNGSGQELYYCYPQDNDGEISNWQYLTTRTDSNFNDLYEVFYGKMS